MATIEYPNIYRCGLIFGPNSNYNFVILFSGARKPFTTVKSVLSTVMPLLHTPPLGASPTFFSSFVGGARKNVNKGAYKKHKIAIPTNIHSKPMLFTNVPLEYI